MLLLRHRNYMRLFEMIPASWRDTHIDFSLEILHPRDERKKIFLLSFLSMDSYSVSPQHCRDGLVVVVGTGCAP